MLQSCKKLNINVELTEVSDVSCVDLDFAYPPSYILNAGVSYKALAKGGLEFL